MIPRAGWIPMILIALGVAACSKPKQAKSEPAAQRAKQDHSPSRNNRQPKNSGRAEDGRRKEAAKPEVDARFQAELLESLIADWKQAGAESNGEELLRKQREIERRATALGPGEALLGFFGFVKMQETAETRARVINEVGHAVFSREDAVKARRWLPTLEDKELRARLCRFAGKFHPKKGIKEYIAAFDPDTECQSAVLTGYCGNLVTTDPSGAVKAFKELIPPTVTFEGLVEVMRMLPPQSDFASISSTLPGDAKNIAKRARAAMLQAWTAAKPEEAAQYVIANPTLASPEQMGVVAFNWCTRSPEDAGRWIGALSQGPLKDEGTAALAKYWTTRDPVKAWEFVSGIDDSKKRSDIAGEVFKEWEKTDKAAATEAWKRLLPASAK